VAARAATILHNL